MKTFPVGPVTDSPGQRDLQVTHRRTNGGILGIQGRVWFLDSHRPLSPLPGQTLSSLAPQNPYPGPSPFLPYLTLFQAVSNFALNLSTSSGSPEAAPDEPRAGPLAPEGARPLGSGPRGPRVLRPSGRRASSGLRLLYCAAAGDTEFMGAPDRRTEGPGWGREPVPQGPGRVRDTSALKALLGSQRSDPDPGPSAGRSHRGRRHFSCPGPGGRRA